MSMNSIQAWVLANGYTDEVGSGISALNPTPTGFELVTKTGATLNFTIPNMHTHTNLNDVLEKLSLDINNKLLFDGQPIKESIDLTNYVQKETGKGLFSGNYNDLINKPASQQPNKSITFTSSDWVQDSIDLNKYTLEITHGLKTMDVIGVTYNLSGDEEIVGFKPTDIDRIKLTNSSPMDGRLVINYSSTITNGTSIGITDLNGFTTDDLSEGSNNKYLTPSEKTIVESINLTSPTNGQVLSYDDATDKWVNETIHDEKVKMSASDTSAKYIDELLDNVTIQNVNGQLVCKNIEGVTVGVTNINTLAGMTENIKNKFDALSNAMKFTGTVATKSDLNAVTGMISGDVRIVLTDETNLNKKITYVYDGVSWHSLGEFTIQVRNFSTNPIDLTSEVTGILPLSHVENSTLIKTIDIVDDLLHADSNKPSSANQSKILKGLVDTKTQVNDSGVAGNTTDTYSVDKIISLLNDKQNKMYIQSTQPSSPSLNAIWIDTTNSENYTISAYNGTSFIPVGSSEGALIKDWTSSTSYTINTSFVINNNLLYRCKITHTSGTTFDVANWTLIGGDVTTTGTQTLSNKTFIDSTTTFSDDSDSTKLAKFECSGITTGNTRTLTVPNKDGTIALTSDIPSLTTTEYLSAYQTTAQSVTTGTLLKIDGKNAGNMTLNSDGTVNLTKDKTYLLSGGIGWASATDFEICFRNITTGTDIQMNQGHVGSGESNSISTHYTAPTDCKVGLYVKYAHAGGSVGLYGTRNLTPWMTITQIGSSAVSNIPASFLGTMTGATSSVNGASGAVPQPLTGQQNSFLRGDGTWGMSIYKGTVSIGDVGGTSGNLPVSGDIISATTTTGSAVSITINHPSVSANAIYNITTENISNQLYANDITQTVFTRISNNQIRVYYEETSTSVQGIKLNIMIYD